MVIPFPINFMKTKLLTICLLLFSSQVFAGDNDLINPITGVWQGNFTSCAKDGYFIYTIIIYKEKNKFKYISLNGGVTNNSRLWIEPESVEEEGYWEVQPATASFSAPQFNSKEYSFVKDLFLDPNAFKIYPCYEYETGEEIEIDYIENESLKKQLLRRGYYKLKNDVTTSMQLSEIIECVKDNANEGTTYSKFKKKYEDGIFNTYFDNLPKSRECFY